MIDVAVFGRGRMGSSAVDVFEEAPDIRVVAILGSDSPPPPPADVFVDFTLPHATASIATWARERAKGLVVGTTALTDAGSAALDDAALRIPVVVAPNLSVGVQLLIELVRTATRTLPNADVEILDVHHRHKIDSPSGTAHALFRAISDERNVHPRGVHGRSGSAGPRASEEIGMHSLRAGDVVGEHTVLFAMDGERVELTHRASSRRAFGAGAVAAVRFVEGRSPGRYGMHDVLGFGDGGHE